MAEKILLEWTDGPPNQAGWYWLWDPMSMQMPHVVMVKQTTLPGEVPWHSYQDWESGQCEWLDCQDEIRPGSKWFGPLQHPTVPEGEV